MKVKMYECGDGVFTYDELKDADPMSEELKILEKLEVNESHSFGTSGYVRRVQ